MNTFSQIIDKMGSPLLSIITINLNNASGLRKTIESVVSQTFTDYEYIIIDGGSTDGSVELIKEFSGEISYWISEPDKGIYYAMNKGIKAAKGDWIGIINSGDWYETGAFEVLEDAILSYPNMQIFHGVLRVWLGEQIFRIQGIQSSFLPQGMIEHPTCFVKRDVYQDIGDFDLNYKISADYEFMVRALTKKMKFHFIDKILANYTLGGISCTSPNCSVETNMIKQQYGFIPPKLKGNKWSEILSTLRHLVWLILPDNFRKHLNSLSVFLLWFRDL